MPAAQQQFLFGFEELAEEPSKRKNETVRRKTVYVIDAHSLIFQVFHAMPPMSGPAGQPVGAVYGFIRDVADLIEKQKPDLLFCAFDSPGDTFRHELYDQYKSHRPDMPEDLRPQIEFIKQMLDAMGIAVLAAPGYEADDILATIAGRCDANDWDCFLVTSDKDCRQLINDRVKIFLNRKNQILDAAAVVEDWGVRPDQVVDFQAMWGDSVDNVPGIPGIGKKNARELLEQYGTLAGVYEHLDEMPPNKRRENIAAARDQAWLSRQLVKLDDDVPIEIDWDAATIGGGQPDRLESLCNDFGFRGLAARATRLTVHIPPAEWITDYRTIESMDQLHELVERLKTCELFSFDTETTSANPRWAELVGMSFAVAEGVAWYLPVRAPASDPQLPIQDVFELLRPVLEDPAIGKVGQNLKYDIVVLKNYGIRFQGLRLDTMVADYLLEAGQRNHGLNDLSKRYLNHETIKITELIGTGRNQKPMERVPVELVTPYACEDADVPWRLTDMLQTRLVDDGLADLFHDVERPLIKILADMEFAGVRIDVPKLEEMGRRFGQRLAELEVEIHELAGHTFNIASPQQLAQVLFDELKLTVVRRNRSTDIDVLEELAEEHALPGRVAEFRQWSKLKSTYVDALANLVCPATGRVHTSFKQDVAATGRLSSTDPNLQNIPIRTEEGRQIRSAFLPAAGWKMLGADYSQIELRVLAHFCEDEGLREAFENDVDIHRQVAGQVHNVPLEEVTSEMRRGAKAVNFGVIYGQSPYGLAKSLGIEKEEAAAFIDQYFKRFPGVERFMNKTLDECRATGYVSTILGRRRVVQGVRDASRRGTSPQRTLPERIAINTVIQGSAADLIKLAMIRMARRLREDESLGATMLLQIHDELLFECPPSSLDRLTEVVVEEMSSVYDLSVPLKVDTASGDNWAEC